MENNLHEFGDSESSSCFSCERRKERARVSDGCLIKNKAALSMSDGRADRSCTVYCVDLAATDRKIKDRKIIKKEPGNYAEMSNSSTFLDSPKPDILVSTFGCSLSLSGFSLGTAIQDRVDQTHQPGPSKVSQGIDS